MGDSLRIFRVLRPVAIAAVLTLASCDKVYISHDGHSDGGDEGDQTPPTTQNAPASVQGSYKVEVGGFYVGRGTGSVGDASATLDVPVKDDSGATGSFHADLTIARGHFTGTGTVMGHSLVCNGRLDTADVRGPKGSVLIRPRLVGTFTSSDGHHGRFTGEYAAAPDQPHTSD